MSAAVVRAALHRARAWERHHTSPIPKPVVAAHRFQEGEDRLASAITDFAGSMRFVYLHAVWFGLWIAFNAGLLIVIGIGLVPFDVFPFGLLTLVVSLEAIFLSTFVMISQNRQSAIGDARAEADYAAHTRAEGEF